MNYKFQQPRNNHDINEEIEIEIEREVSQGSV